MLIDSHAHLTDSKYTNLTELKKHWEANGISNVFSVGYDLKSSIECVKIANAIPSVYAIVGIHPDELKDFNNKALEEIKELAKNDKVLAIGEIGLDYHSIESDNLEIKTRQKELFVAQIKLADELNLPIMIHLRDACLDLINILKENIQYLNHGGIIHCFSESVESFEIFKKMGFVIGVGGVVTFKNGKKLQDVVKKAELSDIILETDCPYLSPEPYRGQTNEPSHILDVAYKICDLKNITLDELRKSTYENIKRVFPKFKG